jgi:S-adenosylmethionine synthetase
MTNVNVSSFDGLSAARGPVEIVERKGLGHPDTICDALAEELSLALCRYYREHFGFILHHNVDKALLWGGRSRVAFGGGEVIEPIEIFLAGRATREVQGVTVPVEELVVETSRQWFRNNMRALAPERHVKLHTMVRPGSSALVDLYLRQRETQRVLANDTSCGAGFAPLDDLERLTLETERHLNSPDVKNAHPELGEDIKIMGVRQDDAIHLTVACALVDRHVESVADYLAKKSAACDLLLAFARERTPLHVTVSLNTADTPHEGGLYLTVTGTSAEAGDDGEVGRGNRANGLITPYRPMTLEAAAGKNPVTHVGKLYNILAGMIAASVVDELDSVAEAQCYLVSRIGHPIDEPQAIDLRLQLKAGERIAAVESKAREIAREKLSTIFTIQDLLLSRAIKVY